MMTASDARVNSHADDRNLAAGGEMIHIPPLKSAFDKGVALFAVVVLSPLFVLVALAIKVDGWLRHEDRGPVFYKEDRVSQGRVFSITFDRAWTTAQLELKEADWWSKHHQQ